MHDEQAGLLVVQYMAPNHSINMGYSRVSYYWVIINTTTVVVPKENGTVVVLFMNMNISVVLLSLIRQKQKNK